MQSPHRKSMTSMNHTNWEDDLASLNSMNQTLIKVKESSQEMEDTQKNFHQSLPDQDNSHIADYRQSAVKSNKKSKSANRTSLATAG